VNTVEDKIRAATRAQAATLREMRPLRLPPPADRRLPEPASGTPTPRARRARRLRTWIAPVTAAAAVIALAITLIIVRDIPNGHGAAPAGPVPAIAGVPRYYVTLYTPPQPAPASKATSAPCALGQPATGCGSGPAVELLVGDTFTGARVAVVPPPAGSYFSGVVAAADDRTFAADATSMTTGVKTWYLLRIAPGTSTPARLTKLPIPALPTTTTTSIAAMALSGSGREIAVAVQQNTGDSELRIYSLATGRLLRSWSTKDRNAFGNDSYYAEQSRALTWIDGDSAVAFSASWLGHPAALTAAEARLEKEKGLTRTELIRKLQALVKQYGGGTFHMTWRRLDVAAGGGDLMADSKVIWSWTSTSDGPYSSGCDYGWFQVISADGKTVMCPAVSLVRGTERKPLSLRVAWLAFSLPAGAARTLYQVTVDGSAAFFDGLWTSASGGTVIGEWGVETANPARSAHFGVLSHGTFTRLPTPPQSVAVGPSITW
jgi:hypothetical protein